LHGRVIDLSGRGARRLGIKKNGVARVKVVALPARVALE
jgi:rare lipoprotein A (peptidoglycan hydrolase)